MIDKVYQIVIESPIVSKKNAYAQTKTGRRFKPKSVKDAEDLAIQQLPPEMYGLELKHPALEFFAFVPKKNWALDRDGLLTTILDYLVKFKILKDDNIRNFNGKVLVHTVLDAPRKRFVLRIYPDGILCVTPDSEIEGLR